MAKRVLVLFSVLVVVWVGVLFTCQWALQSWWQSRYNDFGQQVLQAVNQGDKALMTLATDDLAGRLLLQQDALHVYTEHAPYRQTQVWHLVSVNIDPFTWQNQAQISATIRASDVIGRLTLVLKRQQDSAKLQDIFFEIAPN